MNRKKYNQGQVLVPILVFGAVAVYLIAALASWSATSIKASNQTFNRETAFQIAEAGTDYYRWHLAHAPTDYQDGTTVAGPYLHNFFDKDGNSIGQFALNITPPPIGSTLVQVESTGEVTADANIARKITTRLAKPSFAKYAVVTENIIRFGEGTEVSGPIHSNNGIRFDGLAHNIVSSAVAAYNDPDHDGSGLEYGVHTHVYAPPGNGVSDSPLSSETLPPDNAPARYDVFFAGRQLSVSPVDFSGITVDLSEIKIAASSSGILLSPSGGLGYHLTLRDDDKVDMRVVNTNLRCQYKSGVEWRDYGYCSNDYNRSCYQNGNCQNGGTCTFSAHSIGTASSDQSTFIYQGASSLGVNLPESGLIFVQDDLWVDGVVDGTRLTIIAAKEPLASGRANIYLNKDLLYTPPGDTSGNEVVGLVAQENVLVGYFSQNNLRIDAALIAQKGRVGRPYYGYGGNNSSYFQLYPTSGQVLPSGGGGENSCDDFRKRDQITIFGAIATSQRYGFAWAGSLFSCGGDKSNSSGYCLRNLIYDGNLLYGPPPSFPLTADRYVNLSWEE